LRGPQKETASDMEGTGGVGPRLPYRAGLDGVRALAVAGVVLYHAGVRWVPGGFLGVDVFFVLSGYLITSLLLSERSKLGRVDLRRFWTRRARRLLPAVLLVVAFALLATSTIARDDLSKTRGDALASLVYLTNWHLIIASQSYFNAFGRPSLLQHLWSLAVEEQFYLVWPLLLLGGLALLGRARTIALTALIAIGSTVLMVALYQPGHDPSRVYYGTDTRASTLLVGALLAFAWPAARLRADIGKRPANVLDGVGVIALAGVLALFWRVHDYDPGIYEGGLLGAAICAAVLIAIVAHPATRLGRALGSRPLRWIGVRSYGIYLWHWPIMMLTRPGVDVSWHGPLLVIAQVAVTLAVAALSYRYVEQPIRTGTAQRAVRGWLARQPESRRLQLAGGGAFSVIAIAVLAFGLPAPRGGHRGSRLASPAALVRVPQPISEVVASHPRQPGSQTASGEHPGASSPGGRGGTRDRLSPLPAGPILAFGDSVMLGCEPDLERLLGSRLKVDAIVGRQTDDTITRVAEYESNGALPNNVIVQVGDNGPVWHEELVRLRNIVGDSRKVVLVNVRVQRSWQEEVNSTLAQFTPKWSAATLADWYGHSSERMLVDGVHPSETGCGVYAHVLTRALRAANGH